MLNAIVPEKGCLWRHSKFPTSHISNPALGRQRHLLARRCRESNRNNFGVDSKRSYAAPDKEPEKGNDDSTPITDRTETVNKPPPTKRAAEGNGKPPHAAGQPSSNDWGVERSQESPSSLLAPTIIVARTLPRVLMLHTGGTLGMDPVESYAMDAEGHFGLRPGTGGKYEKGLRPGSMLSNLLTAVPELRTLAQMELQVVMNKDSSNLGPSDWVKIAKRIHSNRDAYDAFLLVHGTDTMAFTAAALSLMLAGFRKPIVLTGSQIPLALPRSDAKQNLVDALSCATAAFCPPHVQLTEVAICFGGKLLRGNRAQKVNTMQYQAFDSPSYPPLAELGVNLEWNQSALLKPAGVYRPRFLLETRVLRIPIVPGSDPRVVYGDLAARGVKGVVLEAFGVGNLPDKTGGWMPWLRSQCKKGIAFYMRSQSSLGPLAPQLYHSGSEALKLGVEAGPQMTPETACVKMMLCLKHPDLPVSQPLAGEL